MTTTKDAIPPPLEAASVHQECCMCGDHGLPEELIHCRICQFRYQHRYCSNVYPKAQSYDVCNWCLNQKKNETPDGTTQNQSLVASSLHKKESDQETDKYRKRQRMMNNNNTNSSASASSDHGRDHHHHHHRRDDKDPNKAITTIQYPSKLLNGPTKKRMMEPPDRSPSSITKRILRSSNNDGRPDVDVNGQKLVMRRTKSEMIIRKPVLIRNKVRRYKLLDEVTS